MLSRVLLIDDDVDEHDLFMQALNDYNKKIVCVTANSWSEGSPLIISFSPDVIFLDYNMPVINGAESLKLLRQIKNLKEVKVYVYSASDNHFYKEEVLKLGANQWIVKPRRFEDYSKIFKEVFAA